MPRPPKNIDDELLTAIKEADAKADKLVKEAREAITAAMEARRTTGALIEKLKTFRGQIMLGMLDPIIPAEKVKRMLSINYYDRKGYEYLDSKVQLQKAGILSYQAPKNPKGSGAGPNVIGTTAKSINAIEKVLKRMGGIERLPEWQREELQSKLQPLASAYVKLVQDKK